MLRASRILRDRYAIAHAPAEGRGWLRVFNAAPTAQLLFVAPGRRKKGRTTAASASLRLRPPPFFSVFPNFPRSSPRLSSTFIMFMFHARSSNDREIDQSSRLINNKLSWINSIWDEGNIGVNRRRFSSFINSPQRVGRFITRVFERGRWNWAQLSRRKIFPLYLLPRFSNLPNEGRGEQ